MPEDDVPLLPEVPLLSDAPLLMRDASDDCEPASVALRWQPVPNAATSRASEIALAHFP
jgi:hypothetical protein